MAMVNIGQDNKDDGFYRYKMPKLCSKIEGRGNGIKTNIVNMVEVAKALSRPPSYTTKYFGCVLGAQSKFDEKTGTSTVNGAHDNPKLIQLLEGFIKKYVQCYGCHNPETEIIITKNQLITMKCAACGYLSDVDMRDKLTTFILNNPPEPKKKKGDKNMRRAEKERLEAGKALDEEGKKSKKDGKKTAESKKGKKKHVSEEEAQDKQDSPGSSQKDEDEDDVEWQTDTSAEAAKQRIQEQLSAVTAGMVMMSTEPSDDLPKSIVSPKEEDDVTVVNGAPGGGQNGLTCDGQNGLHDEGIVDAHGGQSDAHGALVAELIDYIQTHKVAEVAEFVSNKELNQDLFLALVEALFYNVNKGYGKEAAKKKSVFAAVAKGEELQMKLLIALEHFFGKCTGSAAKEVAVVLKTLYDEEILDEEVILLWEDTPYVGSGLTSTEAENVRKLSLPFLNWLKEADEEDED